MKLIAFFLGLILLSSCKQMTNEEVINETKKCESAGLGVGYRSNLLGSIDLVQCYPKKIKP